MMNLLQSFMGCMYPDIIRTDSIESMDHDCRFQAANIDEQGRQISRGELQITSDDLIYHKPSNDPTRWPLLSIRRWGYINDGHKFVFEVGRKSPTGEAIYAFRLSRGGELVEKLNQWSSSQQNATNGQSLIHETSKDRDSSINQQSQTRRRDGSQPATTTETRATTHPETTEVRPLSYSLIDFETTKALNESAQAHAASRDR